MTSVHGLPWHLIVAERALEEGRSLLELAIAEAPSRQVRRRLQQKGLR